MVRQLMIQLGSGFQHFYAHPLEQIPVLTNIFSTGLKPPTSSTVLHPGWLISNLQITHLERKMIVYDLPNLHDYVPC